jgi:peptidoglycan/LPS O-acetylase OafA/YrhL
MQNSKSVYFNQLNGLRFIAILFVLLEHWLPDLIHFPTGHLGVVIFFVLSGFLITRILIINANDNEKSNFSKFQKIIHFVIRRALRIFPIYFLVIFLGIIFNIEPIRKLFPWFIFYVPNLYIIIHKHWIGVWDHFWTLAVEEQYYLFSPFILFSISSNQYVKLLLGMICLGFISRLSFFLFLPDNYVEANWFVNYVNPISALDSFGLGGLLAYLHIYQNEKFQKIASSKLPLIALALLCFISYFLDENSTFQHNNIYSAVLEITLFAYFSFFLVAKVAQDKNVYFRKILCFRPFNFLGQISYGLYVYHNFVYNFYHFEKNTLWWYFTRKMPISYQQLINFVPLKFILNFIILVIISSLSWFLIEKPFNNLKNKFD